MEAVCRLCSIESPDLTSIFSFHNDRLLSDMILIICPIKIDPFDELPKGICTKCLSLVLDAISLRENSVKNDIKFRQMTFEIENPEMVNIKQEAEEFFGPNPIEYEEDTSSRKRMKTESPSVDNDSEPEPETDNPKATPIRPIKIQAEKDGSYKCPQCTVKFKFPSYMWRHLRQAHSHVRYKRNPQDVEHENPKACPICRMSFTTASNMRRHVKNMHLNKHTKKLNSEENTAESTEAENNSSWVW